MGVKTLYKRINVNYIEIKKHFKGTNKTVPKNVTVIAKDYINYVTRNGLDNPDGVSVYKLGKINIYEYKRLNGKPRFVPNGDGTFKQVIENVFERQTKYRYHFLPNYNRIKPGLRNLVHGYYTCYGKSIILPTAYKLHPKGDFYPLHDAK